MIFSLIWRQAEIGNWLEDQIMAEQRRVVTAAPENSETPLENLRSWVTPTPWFFVRNHFNVPSAEPATWKLRVHGLVERPMDWTLDDLASLPERTVFCTMECAGNGRSFLQPSVPGVQWGAGAVGHAEWTGIPVRLLLEKAGVKPEASHVVFWGADQGTESDHPHIMNFARSLPLAKALDLDTLIVTRMNGEDLEPIHGFPIRLMVPGWYGVASVKWLTQIEVIDRAFDGYYQTKKYIIHQSNKNGQQTIPVGPMAVKSEILRPASGSGLGMGTNRLFGVAWAGEQAVSRVEVSTDGGRSWNAAELIGLRAPYSWTLWEYLWEVAIPGEYSLLSRAVSAGGQVQPVEHDPLLGGYMIHFSRPSTVTVESSRQSRESWADADTLLYDMNAFAEENTRFPLDIQLEFAGGEGI
jgi:DMSO/TMAO reductase YedYZ molybdopterin-dependent catalytic subunit